MISISKSAISAINLIIVIEMKAPMEVMNYHKRRTINDLQNNKRTTVGHFYTPH